MSSKGNYSLMKPYHSFLFIPPNQHLFPKQNLRYPPSLQNELPPLTPHFGKLTERRRRLAGGIVDIVSVFGRMERNLYMCVYSFFVREANDISIAGTVTVCTLLCFRYTSSLTSCSFPPLLTTFHPIPNFVPGRTRITHRLRYSERSKSSNLYNTKINYDVLHGVLEMLNPEMVSNV